MLTFQIELGSSNVRVGSTIFGARVYKTESSSGKEHDQAPSTSAATPSNTAEQLQKLEIKDKS
jgi:hypothetical protein